MPRPKTLVRKSDLHGKGVFAAQFISQGTIIGKYTSRRVSKKVDSPYVIYIYNEVGVEIERRLGTGKLRYVNHSSDPNLTMDDDTLEFIAIKDIDDGEELTWFYGDEYEADLRASQDFLKRVK